MFGLTYTVVNAVTNEKLSFTECADVMHYFVTWITNGGYKEDLIVDMIVKANINIGNLDNEIDSVGMLEVNHSIFLSAMADAKLFIHKLMNTNIHTEFNKPLPQRVIQVLNSDTSRVQCAKAV